MQKLMRWTAVGGLVCTLTGCGSVHLYDKAADAAATSAKADYDASKITESIKAARAVHDALDAKEIEAFRAVTLAERDLELLSLIGDSGTSKPRTTGDGLVARFNRLADARLAELIGTGVSPLPAATALDDAKDKVFGTEMSEKTARTLLAIAQPAFASLPACDKSVSDLKDSDNPENAVTLLKNPNFKLKDFPTASAWTPLIQQVGAACNSVLIARRDLANAMAAVGGQLGFAIKAADGQQASLVEAQTKAAAAGKELQSAAKALATAQKAAKDAGAPLDLTCYVTKAKATAPGVAASAPAGADKATEPGPAAKKNELCDALGKLVALNDFGIKVISEERLDQINAILLALGGTEPAATAPELETGLALISTTSRFAQALNQYQQAGKLPALEPLLIDKQMTTAQLAYAQAGVQLAKARVQYAQEYRDATQLEANLLLRAKAELGSLGPAPAKDAPCDAKTAVLCASMGQLLEDKKLAQTANGAGESARRTTYRALAYLSESYGVARERQRTAELRSIDADYREALIKSEASLASWNALLSVPIDQLKAYHSDGVTPQEAASLTAQLLQTLGVLGIAVRIK
jgi:hypothetical protein